MYNETQDDYAQKREYLADDRPVSPLCRVLNDQEKEIAGLSEALSVLEDKVRDLVHPTATVAAGRDGMVQEKAGSPFILRIQDNNHRVSMLRERISLLIDTLEV